MASAIFTKKDKVYWTTTVHNGKRIIDHLKLTWMNLPLFHAGQVIVMFKAWGVYVHLHGSYTYISYPNPNSIFFRPLPYESISFIETWHLVWHITLSVMIENVCYYFIMIHFVHVYHYPKELHVRKYIFIEMTLKFRGLKKGWYVFVISFICIIM